MWRFSTSGLMLSSENRELILTWVGVTYLLLWWLNILGLRPEAAQNNYYKIMKIISVHTGIHYTCAIRCGDRFVKKFTYLSFYRPKSVYCQIRLIVRQRKLTSCSRGKPRLFTVTTHTAGKCLRIDKNHDSHSRRGSGRGLYANVDQ